MFGLWWVLIIELIWTHGTSLLGSEGQLDSMRLLS